MIDMYGTITLDTIAIEYPAIIPERVDKVFMPILTGLASNKGAITDIEYPGRAWY